MTFSIYMDGDALESDRYAIGVLKNWYQRVRKMQDSPEEFDFSKSRFHKDIYLSGMFIYLVSPSLCKVLTNALGQDQVNMTTLHHVFASCGFNLGQPEGPAGKHDTMGMVEEIVTRITPLLNSADSQALDHEALSQQVSTQVCDRLQQAEAISLIAEAIAKKLSTNPEHDIVTLQNTIQQFSRQLAEQSELLREQRRVIQRLISTPARSASASADAEPEPLVENLSDQVANMKKVKAKGIF